MNRLAAASRTYGATMIARPDSQPSIEETNGYLEEAAINLPPFVLLKTLSFAFYTVSLLPGSYFYQHPRDELPRVRRKNTSLWMDFGGRHPIFFIQRDDVDWDDEQDCEFAFIDEASRIPPDRNVIAYSCCNAILAFQKLSEIGNYIEERFRINKNLDTTEELKDIQIKRVIKII